MSWPRSLLGRAGLLRLLEYANPASVELHSSAQHWVGFERVEQKSLQLSARAEFAAPAVAESKPAGPSLSPLQMPHVHAVVQRMGRSDAPFATPSEQIARTRLQRDDSHVREAPEHRPLVPQARLLPALRRMLGELRFVGLDLPRLTADLARAQLPRVLPKKAILRWHTDLIVIFDLSLRLWPFQLDMWHLARALEKVCVATQLSIWCTQSTPDADLMPWTDQEDPGRLRQWIHADVRPGSRLLIVSDLGLLIGADSKPSRQWWRFVEEARQRGVQSVALVPLGEEQVPESWAQRLPIHRWSPDSHFGRVHGQREAQQPTGLESLLALMACVRRVDPALLRCLRQLSWPAPNNAGLEGAAWCHAHVEADLIATVRSERVAEHVQPLQRKRQLRRTLIELKSLRRALHSQLDLALEREEDLLWLSYFGSTDPDDAEMARELRSYLSQLAERLRMPGDATSNAAWHAVAHGILSRSDLAIEQRFFAELAQLKQVLLPGSQISQPQSSCWLVHDLGSNELCLQATPPGRRQYMLDDAVTVGGAGVLSVAGQSGVRWLRRAELPACIAKLDDCASLEIETGEMRMCLAQVERPRGIIDWKVRSGRLMLASAELCGTRMQVEWVLTHLPVSQERPDGSASSDWYLHLPAHSPATSGAPTFGLDFHGLYADLLIRGRHGAAIQRLRYMEPGEFLMGAAPDEAARRDHEGPQHMVHISQGFWLADTACTQALWQALMGSSPSHFSGSELPAEQVSWDDAAEFLEELGKLLPESQWSLPTEAQWEYACRAGTTQPFSFGANTTPQLVNYDGNHPYVGGVQGEHRGRAVEVKALPPNPWGLYQMHGNVWEWCADGVRPYTEAAVTDPVGPMGTDSLDRVLRGGSWSQGSMWARSAYRYSFAPAGRGAGIGFRICSRSQSIPPLHGVQPRSSPGSLSQADPAPDAPSRARRVLNRLRRKK